MDESQPHALTIRCNVEQVGDKQWRGSCIVPLFGPMYSGNSLVAAQSLSHDPAEAQHKASTVIKQAMQSPILQAMMPPGAPLAIEAATQLLNGLRTGDMSHVEHVLSTVPEHMKEAMHGIVNSLKEHLPHLNLGHLLGYAFNPYGSRLGY